MKNLKFHNFIIPTEFQHFYMFIGNTDQFLLVMSLAFNTVKF